MRNSYFKRFLILLTLAIAGYMFGIAAPHAPGHLHEAQAAKPAEDDNGTPPAPDFTLANVMGGGQTTLSSLKGKWVFINFWATWCNPCVYEMPMMNTLYNKMKKDGMMMLAVSVDEGPVAPVKQFAVKYKLDFTILHDPDNGVMRRYGVKSIPRTYVVDPDGNIQAAAEGLRDWDTPEMVQFFRDLMDDYDKKKKESRQGKPKKDAA